MKEYSGFEYLCIDIANAKGMDKELFETRIQWVLDNINNLEEETDIDEPASYIKAVQTLRAAQRGEATGHLISLDGVCSGVQILSALTGCIKGATATGLIDPNVRSDAYSHITKEMNRLLVKDGIASVVVSREDAKDATVKAVYGSKKDPENLFGDIVEYYHQACLNVAQGAFELLPDVISLWNPNGLDHSWTLADGFEVFIPVIETMTTRVAVDELGSTITVEYEDNHAKDFSVSLAANITHSIDALVCRNMIRRCSYDENQLRVIKYALKKSTYEPMEDRHLQYYVELAEVNQWVDPVILDHLTLSNVCQLPKWYADKLDKLIDRMLKYPPFELLTVHDAFRCHANNGNAVRYHYKEILAELAESEILSSIMSQLIGKKGKYPKLSNIAHLIRESNYALS